jgi:hypothetical protein
MKFFSLMHVRIDVKIMKLENFLRLTSVIPKENILLLNPTESQMRPSVICILFYLDVTAKDTNAPDLMKLRLSNVALNLTRDNL